MKYLKKKKKKTPPYKSIKTDREKGGVGVEVEHIFSQERWLTNNKYGLNDKARKIPSVTPRVITDLEKGHQWVLIHWIKNFWRTGHSHCLTESPRGLLTNHINYKGILCL